MIGTCNLCSKEKELIRKSHIIPDFLYRNSGMYDDRHRINTFTIEEFLENRKIRKAQTGVYDSNILCADCDNRIIGGYERYASATIYGKDIPVEYCPDCITYGDTRPVFSICKNIDYNKYKLFLLSILFRANISKDDFFDEVNLKPENQEILRQMVYQGNSGNYNDFPFLVSTFATSENITSDIFITPARLEQEGEITYTFLFAGMSILFYEGLNLNTDAYEFMVMKPDNELKIFHFNGDMGNKYFRRVIGME